MRIDRCVCAGRSFASLRQQMRDEGWSCAEMVEHTGASDGCGLCRPYVRRMCQTGQTVFHELLDDEPDMEAGD